MSRCEFIEKCSFYKDELASMGSYGEVVKRNYCEKNPQSCARYLICIKLSPDKVPSGLWPNQMEKAKQFIAAS